MNPLLSNLPLILFTFILVVIFHEVGHLITFKILTKKPLKPYFKDGDIIAVDDPDLKPEHSRLIIMTGLVMGLFPLLVYYLYDKNVIVSLCLLSFYIMGSGSDFKELKKVLK